MDGMWTKVDGRREEERHVKEEAKNEKERAKKQGTKKKDQRRRKKKRRKTNYHLKDVDVCLQVIGSVSIPGMRFSEDLEGRRLAVARAGWSHLGR